MVSKSNSTGHSATKHSQKRVQNETKVPIHFGPFAPLVADGKALAACVEVADNGHTSNQVVSQPTTVNKGSKIIKCNWQGLVEVGEASEGDAAPQRIPSPGPPKWATFFVKSVSKSDKGHSYEMAQTTPFFMVYNDYAGKLGYSGDDIMLHRANDEARYISPLETPEDVAIEDGETLVATARIHMGNANMDTRFKKFVVKHCSIPEKRLKFTFKLTTSMKKVARMWCKYSDMNPATLVLVSHNKPVYQIGTLGQTQITNQDEVSAFTLD